MAALKALLIFLVADSWRLKAILNDIIFRYWSDDLTKTRPTAGKIPRLSAGRKATPIASGW